MKFNLVEGCSNDFFDTYQKIKSDVLKGRLIKDIKSDYKIGSGEWLKYRKQLISDGVIEPLASRRSNGKFYYYHKGSDYWCVYKTVDGKKEFFGHYETEETAQKIVNELKKCNWDKTQLSKIQEMIL